MLIDKISSNACKTDNRRWVVSLSPAAWKLVVFKQNQQTTNQCIEKPTSSVKANIQSVLAGAISHRDEIPTES